MYSWEWTVGLTVSYIGAVCVAFIEVPHSRWLSARAARWWNTGLALFSIAGALSLTPLAWAAAGTPGVLCASGYWIHNRWAAWFVWSKVVELGDTLVLVGRGRPVSFLHAYHHSSVLVFSSHAFATRNPVGFWYMWMNLVVHAVMYSYYAAHPRGRWLAPLITALQLAQMAAGFALAWAARRGCEAGRASNLAGIWIYGSYGALFAKYFYERYVR